MTDRAPTSSVQGELSGARNIKACAGCLLCDQHDLDLIKHMQTAKTPPGVDAARINGRLTRHAPELALCVTGMRRSR